MRTEKEIIHFLIDLFENPTHVDDPRFTDAFKIEYGKLSDAGQKIILKKIGDSVDLYLEGSKTGLAQAA
jgi:hypothetical protein